MTELRNCPFCGGEAEIKTTCVHFCYLKCQTCGTETEDNFKDTKDGREQAIDAWNRRVEDSELQKYRQAEDEGRLVVLKPYAKEGEPKPSCFYTDLAGAPWCLGLANENDDYPISNCQKCWYSEYSAAEREEVALTKEGGGE